MYNTIVKTKIQYVKENPIQIISTLDRVVMITLCSFVVFKAFGILHNSISEAIEVYSIYH